MQDKLTNNAQMALQFAGEEAIRKSHQFLEPEHILWALCGNVDGMVKPLLARLEVPAEPTGDEMAREIACLPPVNAQSGPRLVGAERPCRAASGRRVGGGRIPGG